MVQQSENEVELAQIVTGTSTATNWRARAEPLMAQLVDQGLTTSMLIALRNEIVEKVMCPHSVTITMSMMLKGQQQMNRGNKQSKIRRLF